MQAIAGVGPFEWVSEMQIPRVGEVQDSCTERVGGWEAFIFDGLLREDTEPDFDQVQPGTVSGQEVENDAFMRGLQPLSAPGDALEGW